MKSVDWTGRRALVIGADGEAGRTMALTLAERGMKLALTGGDAAALMRTAALTGRPMDMLVLPADLGNPRDVGNIMHIMEGHFKGLDVLAGALDDGAALSLCRKVLPLLKASDAPAILSAGANIQALAAEAGIDLAASVAEWEG